MPMRAPRCLALVALVEERPPCSQIREGARCGAKDPPYSLLAACQPAVLTATKLMADTRLPLAWTKQRKALGFA